MADFNDKEVLKIYGIALHFKEELDHVGAAKMMRKTTICSQMANGRWWEYYEELHFKIIMY